MEVGDLVELSEHGKKLEWLYPRWDCQGIVVQKYGKDRALYKVHWFEWEHISKRGPTDFSAISRKALKFSRARKKMKKLLTF
mgnify:CR=1 FL=1